MLRNTLTSHKFLYNVFCELFNGYYIAIKYNLGQFSIFTRTMYYVAKKEM